MEKSEMMKKFEAETGKQSAIVKFMTGGQALERKSYPKLGPYDYNMEYLAWLEAKAAAYDRVMGGGKVSNAKEAANFYGRPVASVDREWKVFENLPKYDGYRWWDMESRAFPSGETVHFNIDAFEGDEENSLTLPDGWED
jgi:hypothetical protein